MRLNRQSLPLYKSRSAYAKRGRMLRYTTTNSTLGYCDVPVRDNSLVIEVISGVFGGLAFLFVVLRMCTRIPPFKAGFGLDDVLILAVTVVMMFTTAAQFAGTRKGYGRDLYTVPPDNITPILKWFYAGESMYDFCISVTKLSILAFYLRIFTDRTFKRLTYGMMAICTAYAVATIIATIWQCTPVSYVWTSWSGETEGHCIDVFLLTWIATSLNILFDILIILLPIPHILKLTLTRKKKMQIISMFCVGLFITLTSVVRLQALISFRATTNFTWDYVGVSYMSMLEIDVGIMCACMPALQLLLRRVAPKIFGSTADQSSYLHPHTGSRSRTRTFRHTGSHAPQPKSITKTITTTVTDMPKDSDSVMELVDNDRHDGHAANMDGSSFATVSSEHPQKPNW
ncbi:hypothetical protein LTR84_007424 [Exophiala bonariae]|uniref:Rhodopsin domain-containing protein n=1 Tax=Exophiala bonariae TaxID=1690606 RepID=A0AAV9N1H7_9EURO|nr:hypothetical protein LTR84_007424 [Exophiala bonariae]